MVHRDFSWAPTPPSIPAARPESAPPNLVADAQNPLRRRVPNRHDSPGWSHSQCRTCTRTSGIVPTSASTCACLSKGPRKGRTARAEAASRAPLAAVPPRELRRPMGGRPSWALHKMSTSDGSSSKSELWASAGQGRALERLRPSCDPRGGAQHRTHTESGSGKNSRHSSETAQSCIGQPGLRKRTPAACCMKHRETSERRRVCHPHACKSARCNNRASPSGAPECHVDARASGSPTVQREASRDGRATSGEREGKSDHPHSQARRAAMQGRDQRRQVRRRECR